MLFGFGLLVILSAFAAWLSVEALDAKWSLEQARGKAEEAKDALLRADTASAAQSASEAKAHAQAARDATHSVPWQVAAVVPWLGEPFQAGQQIAEVALGLVGDVLEPATDVGTALAPERLIAEGRIDVFSLRTQEPRLTALSESATQISSEAREITNPTFPSMLRTARTEIATQTSDLANLLNRTAVAARLLPSMMGADGPRTYFMGFQTNAEARGTGGLLGGYGILRFDNGTASVDTLGPNAQLDKQFAPLDLGPDYADLYGFGDPTTDYRNSNFSPHFPYAAQIWKSMWSQQTGQNVDGAIAIDPIALSYILGAVGPVTMPDGEVITPDNVVELTESIAYKRFPADQNARKTYLQGIAGKVVEKITGPVASPRLLFDALGKAVSEGRIAVWSSSPTDQALIEQTPFAHTVPDDAAPYAAVVINNLGGNKLDYYLRRKISYTADGCDGDMRNTSVSINLQSSVPPGLPDYVSGTAGLVTSAPIKVVPGTMVTSVRLIATQGATLRSAFANDQRVPVFKGIELGHPTFEVQVAIPAGKSGSLVFNLSEPTTHGAARVPVQPLVDEVVPSVTVPDCAA